jgi:hypothetical protein
VVSVEPKATQLWAAATVPRLFVGRLSRRSGGA